MPNGFQGSLEEWQQMEAPFLEIDDLLEEFAAAHNLKLTKNYHNWPRRELAWINEGIHRTISILEGDKPETYNMSISAFQDSEDQRYHAYRWLKERVSWPEIVDNLRNSLEGAFVTLESWTSEDLKTS
jgi:hypothetical protein